MDNFLAENHPVQIEFFKGLFLKQRNWSFRPVPWGRAGGMGCWGAYVHDLLCGYDALRLETSLPDGMAGRLPMSSLHKYGLRSESAAAMHIEGRISIVFVN